jgi:transposase
LSAGDPLETLITNRKDKTMIVIGVDAHKATHTCAAVQELTGRHIQTKTTPARDAGHGQLLEWARQVDSERVWAIEDCRHVTGRLERMLLARGERVIRVPPKLTAGARTSSREAGKSDPIDALVVARVAIREGIETFVGAQLDEEALEIRQLVDHRERLVWQRTALINNLRWHLHDLDPDFQVPRGQFNSRVWQQKTIRKLSGITGRRGHVRVAKDEIRRIRELTNTINDLYDELAELVTAYRPALLELHGCGVLSAAKAIGEAAGGQRFATASKFARLAGVAPLKASSGQQVRHRFDRGGNRQLNAVLHRIAITQIRSYQPARDYYQRKLAEKKSSKEALRCLKRQIATAVWTALQPDPENVRSRHRIPVVIHCNTPIP